MLKMVYVELVIVFMSAYSVCNCDVLLPPHPHTELLNKLFVNYSKDFIPMHKSDERMNVSLYFSLLSINSLSETSETLSVSGVFEFLWNDKFLRWNRTDDTPSFLLLPQERIWVPDIDLVNSIKAHQRIGYVESKVYIFNTGAIALVHGDRFDTHCNIKITKFPFDTQVCDLVISPKHGKMSGELLKPLFPDYMLEHTEANGKWEIDNISMMERFISAPYASYAYQEIIISLVLTRRSQFHLFNSILPVIFISILNTMVFLMPDANGEKMGMSVSLLLSYAIFLSYINDSLPHNSDTLCYFSVYMMSLLLVSTIITVVTVVILSLYHTPESISVPPHWKRLVLAVSGSEVKRRLKVKDEDISETSMESAITWQDGAKAFSKMAFWVFLVLVISVHGVFFYVTLS